MGRGGGTGMKELVGPSGVLEKLSRWLIAKPACAGMHLEGRPPFWR